MFCLEAVFFCCFLQEVFWAVFWGRGVSEDAGLSGISVRAVKGGVRRCWFFFLLLWMTARTIMIKTMISNIMFSLQVWM